MIDRLYIFVEGARDKNFIETIFQKQLLSICKNYNIIEYSGKKNKSVNSYIDTIRKQIPNWDYIFISDQDGNNQKRNKVLHTYKSITDDKLFLSIFEIESWILAGISNRVVKKYNVSYNFTNTSNITKEMFNKLVPSSMTTLEFISIIINDYKLENAVKLNSSLDTFNSYLENKKAS